MLYKTTIRPVLDYGDIIYDACLKSESDAIEKCQRKHGKAAIICTGAFRHTSNERLLVEFKHILFDKLITCVQTRAYIQIYYRVYKLGFRKKS